MKQGRALQQSVLAELAWDPSVTADHISVVTGLGVVTLTGHVPNFLEKQAAEQAAVRVKGVKAIVENLEVRLSDDAGRGDDAIARAALERIAWEVAIPTAAINVQVENGWVTLTGEVEWHYQRTIVEQLVQGLRGIVGLTNITTIARRGEAADLGADIRTAIRRLWFDPSTITVSAQNGKVSLNGTVLTPGDRGNASSTAWASPGTVDVENNLVVVGPPRPNWP